MNSLAAHPLQGYYRWHARIYDGTRWSFLFGRKRLVRLVAEALAAERVEEPHIAEVGCGTGRNLAALAKALPKARLTGVDLCAPMLKRASRSVRPAADRTRLTCAPYGLETLAQGAADVVIFSYALSMFNPGYAEALDAARAHLRPGGLVAVADFGASPLAWFRAWMGVNHVRLDGHLLPALAARFATVRQETRPAYGGLWNYFLFLGRV